MQCVLKCAVDPHHAANTCRDWVFKRRPPHPWLTGPIDFLGFCRHRFPASQRPHVGGQGAPGRSEPALATSQSEGPLKENQSCHKWEASKIFPLYGQGPSACLHSVAKVRHLSSQTGWRVLEMPVNPWVDCGGVRLPLPFVWPSKMTRLAFALNFWDWIMLFPSLWSLCPLPPLFPSSLQSTVDWHLAPLCLRTGEESAEMLRSCVQPTRRLAQLCFYQIHRWNGFFQPPLSYLALKTHIDKFWCEINCARHMVDILSGHCADVSELMGH